MSGYRLAVVLSGGSAALGLLRELLVYRRLGLGSANDELQFALSITYTIALLGEPLRMASLNLLSRRLAWSSIGLFAGLVAMAMVGTTLAYVAGGPALPGRWVVAAAAAGGVNLIVSWTIPRRLRDGPFLSVHALTVLPNAIIVGGLLLPVATDAAFAGRVILLFLLAPVVQLAGFQLLGRQSTEAGRPETGPTALVSAIGWHGIAAAGGMSIQFVIRSALTAVPGTLSAFTLMLRITETVRAVFVDSWVASRVQGLHREREGSAVAAAGRLLPPAVGGLVVLAGLLLAWYWPGEDGTLLAPAATVVVIGLYPVVVFRVGWQALNTTGRPGAVLVRVAMLEWAVAAAGVLAVFFSVQPVALLPWLAYVVRPAAGVRLMSASAGGET